MTGLERPPIALTADEGSLLVAYRATDERGRIFLRGMAEAQAARNPGRAAPKLRLVTPDR
jgi:hypothetical protein